MSRIPGVCPTELQHRMKYPAAASTAPSESAERRGEPFRPNAAEERPDDRDVSLGGERDCDIHQKSTSVASASARLATPE